MLQINSVNSGNCLDLMNDIDDKSIDMILCDLPYGTTACKWDTVIPFEPLWAQYRRVCKPNAAIVLTAQAPFDKALGASNLPMLRYEWIWEKEAGTGFLNAKLAPLKSHENVLVFYTKPPTYNPQMTVGKAYAGKFSRKNLGSDNYGDAPEIEPVARTYEGRYPKTVLKFPRDRNKIHPTQKPVALFEYLIKTYTNEGELVLDNCAGSGTTAIACLKTNRNYILIEQETKYCDIANKRIAEFIP